MSCTRVMRANERPPSNVISVFRFHGVEDIARWCGVSISTAKHYKNGTRKPSPQAVKLFHLYASRKVLGEHWQGWLVNGNELVNPEGGSFTQAQLQAYTFIWQLASMYAQAEVHATLEELERRSA